MSDPTKTQVGGDHYRTMAIQPEAFIHANGIGFHEGNAIKYLCRWREKGGPEDLMKARHYIDLLIKHETDAAEKRNPALYIIRAMEDGRIVPREESKAEPAPKVPDPGPGWRIRAVGEQIAEGDQVLGFTSRTWHPAMPPFGTVLGGIFRTPVYHNPAKLESASEGYRFCLVSETREDATHFWVHDCHWEPLGAPQVKEFAKTFTYRTNKPLPTGQEVKP